MRHNSFQKIYASYIAPNPDMDVLWMDLKADPYGSVIKFWNGGIGKYELISSDASTIGKHIIYADDIELPVRSSINFKGFEITDDQPSDSMTISVEGKEDAGIAQSIVDSHELEFNHSDIHHENRAALNNVSGTNTGDQDLSGLLPIEHLSDFNHADISHNNRSALDSVSGVNTGDQDLSGLQLQIDEKADSSTLESYILSTSTELNNKVDKEYGHSLISDVDKARLSLTSGTNTGDQDLTGLVEKVPLHSLVPDTEIDKLSEYPELLEETTNKVISDTGELVSIPTPSGGYANNLYLGETDSDVAGYKILTYIADTAEIIKTVTARESAGIVTAQTFLYPTGVSVSNFPSGLWSLKLWGNISASAGVSQIGFTYFKRSVAGVETDLFTLWSEEVNNTSDIWIDVIGTQPSYSVDPTDRMGLRLLFKTTSGTNKTLTYSIGDGYAAFVNNPNQIRHSQTRDKNGESEFQHVDTTTEKGTPIDDDKIALYNSVSGNVEVTKVSDFKNTLGDSIVPNTNESSMITDVKVWIGTRAQYDAQDPLADDVLIFILQ